jgi:mercuric ion transport protein
MPVIDEAASADGGWRIAPRDEPDARRAENRGRLWLVLSYLLCPCHLPISMALIATVAGGTAVGAALTANAWRAGTLFTVLYGLALWRGFHHLRRAKAAVAAGECASGWCEVPAAAASMRSDIVGAQR